MAPREDEGRCITFAYRGRAVAPTVHASGQHVNGPGAGQRDRRPFLAHDSQPRHAAVRACAIEAQHHLHKHVILARSVTMEQVAISISAIAVLTSRRRFWFLAMGFGAAGILFLAQGLWG